MTDDAIAKPREDLWSRLFPCSREGTLTTEELYYIVRAVEAYEPSQDALRLCECELTTYRALSAQANSEAWNEAIDAARGALTLAAGLPEAPEPEPDDSRPIVRLDDSEADVPIVRDVDSAITEYCARLVARAKHADCEHLRFEPDPRGKKYTRIVRVIVANSNNEVVSRSVHAFVERATGDIWKADSWKRPALNFVRGSVYDEELSGFALFGIL